MIKSTVNPSSNAPIVAVCSQSSAIDDATGTLFTATLSKPIVRRPPLPLARPGRGARTDPRGRLALADEGRPPRRPVAPRLPPRGQGAREPTWLWRQRPAGVACACTSLRGAPRVGVACAPSLPLGSLDARAHGRLAALALYILLVCLSLYRLDRLLVSCERFSLARFPSSPSSFVVAPLPSSISLVRLCDVISACVCLDQRLCLESARREPNQLPRLGERELMRWSRGRQRRPRLPPPCSPFRPPRWPR